MNEGLFIDVKFRIRTGRGIGILLFKPWENRHYTLALDHGIVLFLRVSPLASRFFKKYGSVPMLISRRTSTSVRKKINQLNSSFVFSKNSAILEVFILEGFLILLNQTIKDSPSISYIWHIRDKLVYNSYHRQQAKIKESINGDQEKRTL